MKFRILALSIGLASGIAACGSEPAETSAVTAPAATVEIADLYIIAPSPGRSTAGGGMQITATGGDYRLVSASSENAERVEMHTILMEDDVMQMRQVDGFDIAAGETLNLGSGGPHLMIYGLDEGLQIGDETEMLFTFETSEGEPVTLNYRAEIRSITDQ